MIRASVTAANSFVVDAIASVLAGEICPDVLQLTYRQPYHVYEAVSDHRSVVVDVDEGESLSELMIMPGDFRFDIPLLVMGIALKSRGVRAFKAYPLVAELEQLIELVRGFSRTHFPAETWNEYSRCNQERQALSPVGLGPR